MASLKDILSSASSWQWLSMVAGVTTTFVALVGLSFNSSSFRERLVVTEQLNRTLLQRSIDDLEAEWKSLQPNQTEMMRTELQKILSEYDGSDDVAAAAKYAELNLQVEELSKRTEIIEAIELAITESPEKALSIPLLRKDIEQMQRDVSESLVATRAEIDRIYDLSMWFLGLMGTMSIGIIGLAVGNFLKK